LGEAPYCTPCGECFDNWDEILNGLSLQTSEVIEKAKKIKTQGATGAYTKEFEDIEKKIDSIKSILSNTTVSARDIKKINENVDNLRKRLEDSEKALRDTDGVLDKLNEEMNLAEVEISNLGEKSEKIKGLANALKANATTLQEANVEGALNLTRDAWTRVQSLSDIYAETSELNSEADRQCKRIENIISRQLENEQILSENDKEIETLQAELNELNSKIPDLNEQICDKRGDPCDSLCGGAGCNKCGGISCEKGALTRTETALNYAKDAKKIIEEKERQAEELIRSVSHVKTEAAEAHKKSKDTFENVQRTHNSTETLLTEGRDLIKTLNDIISNDTASPDEIKEIAEGVLKLNLHLDPDEIKHLANNIDKTVAELENVDQIIENTRFDLEMVEQLKTKATDAE
jgi:laminin, beta 1